MIYRVYRELMIQMYAIAYVIMYMMRLTVMMYVCMPHASTRDLHVYVCMPDIVNGDITVHTYAVHC